MAFLGKTQKEEIIAELKIARRQDIIKSIEDKGSGSPFLDFTDVDSQQIGIKINDETFIYSQANKFMYSWEEDNNKDVEDYSTDTICLSDFDENEISNKISGHYDSIEEIKKEYKDDYKRIVAECIFEYEN